MASKINADEFVDREGEGKPTLPKGVVLSGVTTITTAVVAENEVANSTGINAGIITSTHFSGNLTGDVNAGIVTVTSQTVVGSAVTISASGIDIGAGVITATSYAGSGANLTGLGATIMVWEYNPDPGDMAVPFATGIGITFNQKIKAGSGNITLREDSSSGTVVENFGIGSSVTIAGNSLSMTPTSDLSESKIYHLSYPSGVITNMAGESYVGTAYTFQSLAFNYQLFTLGINEQGRLGHNSTQNISSPVQVPGTTWKHIGKQNYTNNMHSVMIKSDGTLWSWGYNGNGHLAQNNRTEYSSPVQIGSGSDWATVGVGNYAGGGAIKTDGTLWVWGNNGKGQLGQNTQGGSISSPVQIPGTTWSKISGGREGETIATKTDGTCWTWGNNENGELGQNNRTLYSSPTQLPGTTWSIPQSGNKYQMAIKTDGTLWSFGYGQSGVLGHNQSGPSAKLSSPTQIGSATTWASISCAYSQSASAIKTDGTLWVWGDNNDGGLGLNSQTDYATPQQMGSATNWSSAVAGEKMGGAIKTTGECWVWGQNNKGQLGQNSRTYYSSPVQIPGTSWNDIHAMKEALILQTKS